MLRKSGHRFHTTAEREVVREIKESKCYVTYDPDKEEQLEMEQGKTFAMHTLPDGNHISVGYVYLFAFCVVPYLNSTVTMISLQG